MKSGIYCIENKTNGHRYVGGAVDLKQRKHQHLSSLRGNRHHSRYLQRAWNKYGEDAFEFSVIEYWEPEFLVSFEQWWMNMLRPEYNIAPVAGNTLGVKHTDEARANMAAAQTGKKHTKEHRANVSAAKRGNTNTLGHTLTKEHKAKISESLMGHNTTDETRAKLSAAAMGNKHGLGNPGNSGQKLSAKHRTKISAAMKGKPWSAARRAAYEARAEER